MSLMQVTIDTAKIPPEEDCIGLCQKCWLTFSGNEPEDGGPARLVRAVN